MTVADILAQAIVHKEMSIDSVNGRTHINDALNILAILYDTAKVQTTTTIACTDEDVYYALPAGCISVFRVEDSDGLEYNKLFYRVEAGNIKFEDEDTFTVVYLARAASVTLDSQTPTINDLYHRTLAKYVAYKELKTIKIKEAEDYKTDFFQEAAAVDLALRKGKKRGRFTPVDKFR